MMNSLSPDWTRNVSLTKIVWLLRSQITYYEMVRLVCNITGSVAVCEKGIRHSNWLFCFLSKNKTILSFTTVPSTEPEISWASFSLQLDFL